MQPTTLRRWLPLPLRQLLFDLLSRYRFRWAGHLLLIGERASGWRRRVDATISAEGERSADGFEELDHFYKSAERVERDYQLALQQIIREVLSNQRGDRPTKNLQVLAWGSESVSELAMHAGIDVTYLTRGASIAPTPSLGAVVETVSSPDRPPTSLPSAYFDVVVGLSQIPPLTELQQTEWLKELRRITKTGANVIISVNGAAAVARQRHWSLVLLTHWQRYGLVDVRHPDLCRLVLASEPPLTYHNRHYIERLWSQHFEIVDIVPALLKGIQDVVILRRPLPTDVHDHYHVSAAPTVQNAADIFKGEWDSAFPASGAAVSGGKRSLFEDQRLAWGITALGGLQGKRVVELGPFEGGHSYMLQQAEAASVVAIESNTRAFVKCLIVKEIFNLCSVEFLLGDFVQYLKSTTESFDSCVASGVLYHMENPAELISLIATRSRAVYCWTHYYDEDAMARNPSDDVRRYKTHPNRARYQDFDYSSYIHDYGIERTWDGFCGSGASAVHWMTKKDIERCCRHFGFVHFETAFDEPLHQHGPCFSFVARK